jgi:error-prone DNA polymerase
LHCVSNFSFLRGASHPEELVDRARELDYAALAVTDECSLAGVVRAHLQARESKFPLLIGAEFSALELLADMPGVSGARRCFEGFGCAQQSQQSRLQRPLPACGVRSHCQPLQRPARHTAARAAGPQSQRLRQPVATDHDGAAARAQGELPPAGEDLQSGLEDCLALWVPRHGETEEALLAQACWLRDRFGSEGWLAAELLTLGDDLAWLERLKLVERQSGVPLVAAGDVHFHVRSRKSLQDTLTAIQLNKPVGEAGFALAPNAEQHLRSRLRLSQIYPARLLEETLEIASRCAFSLEELRYEYPEEIVPAGETPATWLKKLTMDGSRIRFPEGLPQRCRRRSPTNWN